MCLDIFPSAKFFVCLFVFWLGGLESRHRKNTEKVIKVRKGVGQYKSPSTQLPSN